MFGRWASQFEDGTMLFDGITPTSAIQSLRTFLRNCDFENCFEYRTHDLRRGHAEDLRVSGASLHEILAAGQWRSPAFLSYIDLEKLERDTVIQAHVDESSDEECDTLSVSIDNYNACTISDAPMCAADDPYL